MTRYAWLLVGVAACSSNAAAPDCFETGCDHGTCELIADTPTCVCFSRYAGPTCADCVYGYSDIDHNGLCERPWCPAGCAAHEQCSASATCECVTGYSRGSDGACVFSGGPLDPDLDDANSNAWLVTGGTQIVRSALPDVGDGNGWARFDSAGTLSQTFVMPALIDAEPLALKLDVHCGTNSACYRVGPEYSVTFDGRSFDFLTTTSDPICLGDRAFGHEVTLGIESFAPISGGEGSAATNDLFIGSVRITAAPDCPYPGEVIAPVTETKLASSCQLAGPPLRLPISVPSSGNSAIQFSYSGSGDHLISINLLEKLIGSVRTTTTPAVASVCLPLWSRGFAADLLMTATLQGSCSSADQGTVDIGSVSIVSDPNCADSPVPDPGFESGSLSTAWLAYGSSRVIDDPESAHSGVGRLVLPVSCNASPGIQSTALTIPDAPGDDRTLGPGLKLWYKLADAAASVEAHSLGHYEQVTLQPTDVWTQAVLCLGRETWRHPLSVAVVTNPTTCTADGMLEIDDLSIEADASCSGPELGP